MNGIIIVLLMLSVALAKPVAVPQVQQISSKRFQQTISRQFPSNMLITGANKQRGMETITRAKEFVTRKGCNTHVCFAIDAGVFVSQEEYTLQQDFAALVAAVAALDKRFYVTGVQYGLRRKPLIGLTSNVEKFLLAVNASSTRGPWTRRQRWRRPFWRWRSRYAFRRTLKYCKHQLDNGANSADKIFFIGDVRSPRGGVRLARRFLPPRGNGAICAVAFGRGRKARLERFTGNPDRVIGVQQFGKALSILEEVVKTICEPNNPQRMATSVFKAT